MDGNRRITSYKLKATENGNRYILSQISGTGDLEFQGGFLKCADVGGGCENAYIKAKFSGAYVRVIFRNSYADRFFILQDGSAGSSFELWKTYLTNTVNFSSSPQKIDYVQSSSFEVVNGRSGMGVAIVTADKELVGLNIPLMAPDAGTQVSVQASKLSDLTLNYDLNQSGAAYSQRLSAAIKDVRLINNNGKGDVRLRMDLSSDGQNAGLWLTLSRLTKPTLSVSEIQSFEAKVPLF